MGPLLEDLKMKMAAVTNKMGTVRNKPSSWTKRKRKDQLV